MAELHRVSKARNKWTHRTKALSIKRFIRPAHLKHKHWPHEKRIEVATKWLALGNMRLVSELTGVDYQLCRMWKQQPWWAEVVAEIKASRNVVVDSKLSKIVDKSLEMIEDRLENGDIFQGKDRGAYS
jgi:hypothetical protein